MTLLLTTGVVRAQLQARPDLMTQLITHGLLDPAPLEDQYIQAATLVAEEAQRPLGHSILTQTVFQVRQMVRSPLKPVWDDPDLGDFRGLLEAVRREHPNLCSGDPAEWRRCGGAAAQFIDTAIEHIKETLRQYNGMQSLTQMQGMKTLKLLRHVLEAFYKKEGVALGRALSREVYKTVLDRQSLSSHLEQMYGSERAQEIIAKIDETTIVPLAKRNREDAHLKFCDKSVALQERMAKTVPGSTERIVLFWQLQAIEYEIVRRKTFSLDHYRSFIADVTHPHLNEEERKRVTDLMKRAEEPEHRNKPLFKIEFLDEISRFYRRAQEFALDDVSGKHWVYLDAAQNLATQALHLGVTSDELRDIFSLHHLAAYEETATMEVIQKRPVIVRPDDLPPEVIAELKTMEAWDLVRTYVKWVALMPQMEASEQIKQLVGSVPHGLAYHILDMAKIATQSSGESGGKAGPFSPRRIAALLSHEAEHLKAMAEYKQSAEPDKRWLTNVVQERRAYARQARSERLALEKGGDSLKEQERNEFQQSRFNCELIVRACNILIGLPFNGIEPEFILPDSRIAARRFGIGVGEVDLNAYPTHAVALIGQFVPKRAIDAADLMELKRWAREEVDALEMTTRGIEEGFREFRDFLSDMGVDTTEFDELLDNFPQGVTDQTNDYYEKLGLKGTAA